MLLMCIFMIPSHVTGDFLGQAFGQDVLHFWYSPERQILECSALVEAVDPFKWAPTSILNT